MQPLFITLGLLAIVGGLLCALARLLSQLRVERGLVLTWQTQSGRLEGQLNQLVQTADERNQYVSDLTDELNAAREKIEKLTGNCAEASSDLKNSRDEMSRLNKEVSDKAKEVSQLQEQLRRRIEDETRVSANLASAQKANDEIKSFIANAQTELSKTVAKLATETFGEKGRELQSNLETSNRQAKSDIELVLKPFAEKVYEFQQRVEHLYGEEARQRSQLAGAVGEINLNMLRVASDAVALARAFKGNAKVRGDWGEWILDDVLSSSGLQEGTHYFRQHSAVDDDSGARLKPDVLINMGDQRKLVVDSKVNLVAWHDAINCEAEADRNEAIRKHAAALRLHVRDLAERNYPKAIGSDALDLTIAFVPIENALSGALGADRDLQTYAFERRVVFASPNTLMAVLLVVERIWSRDKLQKEALQIGEQANKVLDSIVKFQSDFEMIGKRIDEASTAFASAKYCWQESPQGVIRRTKKLVELGAKGKQALPEQLTLDDGAVIPSTQNEVLQLSAGQHLDDAATSVMQPQPEVLGRSMARTDSQAGGV